MLMEAVKKKRVAILPKKFFHYFYSFIQYKPCALCVCLYSEIQSDEIKTFYIF